jgi:hypothetical protein
MVELGRSMIINDEKQYIFIAVPRCASGTIRAPLNQPRKKWFKGPTHGTAIEARDKYAKSKFKKYYKFAFVRNPWDRIVSWYHWRNIKIPFKQWLMETDMFLRWKHIPIQKLQCSYFICEKERILVDFVGRYEDLQSDYRYICNKIKVQPITLQQRHKSSHKQYRKYYDEESRNFVSQHHSTDINLFGYTF